jgi:hypothetical protein
MTSAMKNLARAAVPSLFLVAGCHNLDEAKATRLVRAYNDKVIEAFKTGDARLVEGVAGPKEAKKLTGLIGVKLDQGLTLDAQLLEFKVLKVEPGEDQVVVETAEQWYYRERRIGSGEPVGQDSRDQYRMRYVLRQWDSRWVVDEIQFAAPPQVGRTVVPNQAAPDVFHGVRSLGPGSSPPEPPTPGPSGRTEGGGSGR